MSYRPEEQALEPAIDLILEGVKTFSSAVDKRIEANDWQEGHILEISNLRRKLLDLQIDLHKIKNDTW